MFNIFGALGALGRLMPGYVQGQRQAVQDNWNDLNQYNTVQHGQVQNAWDEAMFNPRLSIGYDAAANSRMGVYNNAMDTNVKTLGYPGALQTSALGSLLGPQIQANILRGQLGQGTATGNAWWNPQVQELYRGGVPLLGTYGQPQIDPYSQLQQQMLLLQQQAAGLGGQGGAINTPTILGY